MWAYAFVSQKAWHSACVRIVTSAGKVATASSAKALDARNIPHCIPRGMQWGMFLASKAFADEAVATFPALVTILTQAECQAFWDTKAYAHMADEDFNVETLQGLKLYRDL